MNLRPLLQVLPLAVAVITLSEPAPARAAEIRVVTTTTDLGDLARTIGGERVRVETICRGAQDPHYVRARPSYMVTLSRADLLLAVGLELEVGWLPGLIAGARNPDINPGRRGYLEVATAIVPMEVPDHGLLDRAQGDIHPRGNPHFWLDPTNVQLAARSITARLIALDSAHADHFRANLAAFEQRLAGAMKRWTERMAPFKGTKVVSYHRTFNYFHRRFGLVAMGYVEERPGIPAAPAHLARLIRKMQAEDVGVVFHANYYDRAASDLVAKRTGARILVLPISVAGAPGTSSYIQLIDHIIDTFVAAAGSHE